MLCDQWAPTGSRVFCWKVSPGCLEGLGSEAGVCERSQMCVLVGNLASEMRSLAPKCPFRQSLMPSSGWRGAAPSSQRARVGGPLGVSRLPHLAVAWHSGARARREVLLHCPAPPFCYFLERGHTPLRALTASRCVTQYLQPAWRHRASRSPSSPCQDPPSDNSPVAHAW